jgi:hypothetical protein
MAAQQTRCTEPGDSALVPFGGQWRRVADPGRSAQIATSGRDLIVKWLTGLVLLVVAALVGGCSDPKVPPPSVFYSGVDLQAVVKQCAPQDLKWDAHGSGESGGGSASSYHRNKTFYGDFQHEQDSLDTFMQVLKVELQKAVEAHGGRVVGSVIVSKDDSEGRREARG